MLLLLLYCCCCAVVVAVLLLLLCCCLFFREEKELKKQLEEKLQATGSELEEVKGKLAIAEEELKQTQLSLPSHQAKSGRISRSSKSSIAGGGKKASIQKSAGKK